MSSVFLTNRIDTQLENLKNSLYFSKQNFFRKLVITPSDSVKQELMRYFVKNLGVAAGVRYLNLNLAMQHLLEISTNRAYKFPSPATLPLYLEEKISNTRDLDAYLEGSGAKKRALASHLAQKFIESGIYGEQEMHPWERAIWFQYERDFDIPIKAFNVEPKLHIDMEIHLCFFPHLPEIYSEFLSKLPVQYYLFSPSETFWGDALSERRQRFLVRQHEKREVAQAEIDQLEQYLEAAPKLLRNNCQYGAPLFLDLLDRGIHLEESYCTDKETLLHTIQRDLLIGEETPVDKADNSLQLHHCPSKRREVEALHTTLVNLYKEKPFAAEDVQVLCSDIAAYAPYIRSVFGKEFGYSIDGLPGKENNFLKLGKLGLPVKEMVKFVGSSEWIEKTHVRWGFDAAHKSAVLGCEVSGEGTWQGAFDQLLLGMAMLPVDEMDTFFPTIQLEGSDGEELEKLINEVTRLHTHFQRFETTEMLTKQWHTELVEFLPESERLDPLLSIDAVVGFDSIIDFLTPPTLRVRSPGELPRIEFTPMKQGSILPREIICLLGMDEAGFPRVERSKHPKKPSQTDADRFMFLEAVHSARRALLIFYDHQNETAPPSTLIEELNYPLKHFHHKNVPFHHTYFSKESPLPELSQEKFALAKAFYSPPEKKPPEKLSLSVKPEISVVDLRDLKRFASHPLRFFLNRTLGIYLEEVEGIEKKEFILTALDRARLEIQALSGKDPKKLGESLGLLPSANFKQVALMEIENLRKEHALAFEKFAIRDVYSREVSVKVGQSMLEGQLELITDKGLLYRGTSRVYDILKIWPIFLTYCLLYPDTPHLLCLKNLKTWSFEGDARAELEKYLDYYEESHSIASPIMPSWGEALLLKDIEGMEKQIEKAGDDPYVNWIFAAVDELPGLEHNHLHKLKEVFSGIV